MRASLILCVTLCVLLPHATAGQAEQQVAALFESDWQYRLQTQPEYATSLGEHRHNAKLADLSLAASRADLQYQRSALEQIKLVDRAALAPQQRLSYDLFIYEKEQQLRAYSFYPYRVYPLTAYSGITSASPRWWRRCRSPASPITATTWPASTRCPPTWAA